MTFILLTLGILTLKSFQIKSLTAELENLEALTSLSLLEQPHDLYLLCNYVINMHFADTSNIKNVCLYKI